MNILIIEDDQRVAELIHRGLEEYGFSPELSVDGLSGRSMALSKSYDLIITDILLPGLSGIDFCKEIRQIKPHIPIIMLTALGTTDDKVEGFDAGADDYLVKPFEMRELIVRIRALLKRALKNPEKDFFLKYANLEMDLQTKTVKRDNKEVNLTPKEFDLLTYMVRNSEKVLSRTEIAEKVWNTYFDTGTNFIDVYINYLRKKIDRDFEPKLIHTKPGMGFILIEK
ncbi:response regulator transcription factor [Chryseobacterium populi]|uniref:Response regulator with CheY-like receiver domain and winged-helix DNA-binding domain n=1 Tax=Chryseobacterium populi TaxID=1144316 RepID=J2JU84_9FLAO|nr:response regulator transcription factor [Chryseobacterium populi]EJL71425.1 response regulator with CheY-like receiver domain and winged-helix DNA-binding domain [Chryseobacterium populi]